MKRVLIFMLVMKFSLLFAQNYNDKIITLKGDTIQCHITSVAKRNIYFDIKTSNKYQNKFMSLFQIKNWIIDNDNNSQLLLNKHNDSIQEKPKIINPNKVYVLLAKQTKIKKGKEKTKQAVFITSKKVYIKKYHANSLIKGRISVASDSSISIKGETVEVKDIKKISNQRGGDQLIIGVSSLAITGILLSMNNLFFLDKYDKSGNDNNSYSNTTYTFVVLGVLILEVMYFIPASIIKLATTKHYKAKRGWKFEVVK